MKGEQALEEARQADAAIEGLAAESAQVWEDADRDEEKDTRYLPGPAKKEVWEMKVRPLHDRVIVIRVDEKEKTSGGIIIPDTAKEKPQEGKVVAVGPGKTAKNGRRIALDLKENDRILFGKYAGTDIEIDGIEHLILRQDDILGVME
jgi:chaperonin GroES